MSSKDRLPNEWSASPNVIAVLDAFDAEVDALDAQITATIAEYSIDDAPDNDALFKILDLLNPHTLAELKITYEALGDVEMTRRLVFGLAAAARSHGDVEGVIRCWRAMTYLDAGGPSATFPGSVAEWDGTYKDPPPIRLETTSPTAAEIQIAHEPAPLDDAGFRAAARDVLSHACGVTIAVTHDTAALAAGGQAPDYIWEMQDASLPLVEALGSGVNFPLNDQSPLLQQSGENGRFSVQWTNANQLLAANEPVAGEFSVPVGTGFSFWMRFLPASQTIAIDLIDNESGGGASAGIYVQMFATGTIRLTVEDLNANEVILEIAADHQSDWHNLVVSVDNDTRDVILATDLGTDTDALGGVAATISGEAIGLGANPRNGLSVGYLALWSGYALTAEEVATLANVTP